MTMKEALEKIPLSLNTVGNQKRFELRFQEATAYVEYMQNTQGVIYLTHTEVPEAYEGKGVGSVLMKKVLGHIRSVGVPMAPLCPFVAAYLKRHPQEAEGMLAPGFRIG